MLRKTLVNFTCQNSHNIYKRYASHYGFIGLGNMGARMAQNLIKTGHSLKVYDVIPSNAQAIEGATICSSPAEVAKGASIVITMLPDCDASKKVILSEDGIIKTISNDALVIDCSTIEPKTAQDLAEALKSKKAKFIDAPVSGGVTGAEAGTLTMMVGGDSADVKKAEPILLKMGSRVFHCGSVGAGQITKLCNNLILGASMVATSEGYNLGIKLGVDPKTLAEVINVSTGMSWSSVKYNPVPGIMENVPASRNYEGGFGVKLMAKDMGLAEKAAVTCEAPVPLGAAAHQLYRTMISHGYGNKDFGSVFKFLQGGKL